MDLRFHEVMEGFLQRPGERFDRPFRFEIDVEAPRFERALWGVVRATTCGRVTIDGIVRDAPARGTLEIAPVRRRRLRYTLEIESGGEHYRFEGTKRLSLRHPIRGWTTLRGTVSGPKGELGTALLRFDLRRDLATFVRSFRRERHAVAR